MTGWRRSRLSDFIEVAHGFAFLGEHFADTGPYVLLTPGNFNEAGGFRPRGDKQKHYTGPVPADFVLQPGDLLVAMTEQGEGLLGSAAFVPEGKPCLHNQRLGRVRIRPQAKADLRFIYYLFNSGAVRSQIRATASGTKVRHTSPGRIGAVEVDVPSLPIQRRIASILGAYDDLIEVNRRRIAILEEMARRLFDEWFVHFRFPGHEGHPMVETEYGRIPEGWRHLPFTEVADVLSGGTPKKERADYWGGSIPFFTPRDAPQAAWALASISNITPDGLASCNSLLYPTGTVFITARGTVGKVALAGVPMAMNQSCYALRGRGFGQLFLFGLTQAAVARLRGMSGGAVFDTIIVDTFRKLIVAVPPKPLAAKYDAVVDPLLFQSRTLVRATDLLAASRDLLLPRLISGELSVTAAEAALEVAA